MQLIIPSTATINFDLSFFYTTDSVLMLSSYVNMCEVWRYSEDNTFTSGV